MRSREEIEHDIDMTGESLFGLECQLRSLYRELEEVEKAEKEMKENN